MSLTPRTLALGLFTTLLVGTLAVAQRALNQRGRPATETGRALAVAEKLAPLSGEALTALGPSAMPIAFILAPIGATGPRTLHLVIPLHGSAEEQCRSWQRALGSEFFVLCPLLPSNPGSVPGSEANYPDIASLEARIRESLHAAKARFGRHLDTGPISLSGEGLAADRAVLLARTEPSFFPRVLLLDGGFDAWSPVQIQVFSERGGQRVHFICKGIGPCSLRAEHRALLSRRFGLEAKVSQLEPGRTLGEPRLLAEYFTWLIEGDLRFSVLKKH